MTIRSLFTFTLGLLVSGSLWAVGLGDISVQSKMNEPFKARIALSDVGDLSDTQLRAVLASEAEFAKLKLVRDWRYTQLHFQVDLQNPADPAIVVSSDTAIKEPSMDFLVELSWPNGKLVRGYTVLLEKP